MPSQRFRAMLEAKADRFLFETDFHRAFPRATARASFLGFFGVGILRFVTSYLHCDRN
jgi:hypothetical protein